MWLLPSIIVLLVTLFYIKLLKVYKYWDERGVTYEKPTLIFGNMPFNIFRIGTIHDIVSGIYKKFSNHRYVGIYQFVKPTLLIRDLDLIKQITVKDFDFFSDHITFIPSDIDPLWGKNMFQMSVKDGWHEMRTTLSPSFTSSKMKLMFGLIKTCSQQFMDYFKHQNTTVPIDVKDVFTRFANDVIGTSAFGITCDSLKNPDNEFFQMGREATNIRGFRVMKFFGYSISPMLMKLFGIKLFNKKVSSFFRKTIKDSLDYRKEKNIVRPDMIHLMLEAQKAQAGFDEDKPTKTSTELSYESMTAQALIFITAGFETVSTAMSFLAYDVAVNSDVQEKLYTEITEVLGEGSELTYEILLGMKYLDCVVSESFRLHPPIPILDRKCVKPYTINPVLPSEKPVHLEEGCLIWIPAVALQKDEHFFPNPTKFDPERFGNENKSKIPPYSYLPFGAGPRVCIGSRFALMEVKLLLVEILRNFEIVPNEKTQIPLKLSKSNFNSIPDEGIWLSLKPRVSN